MTKCELFPHAHDERSLRSESWGLSAKNPRIRRRAGSSWACRAPRAFTIVEVIVVVVIIGILAALIAPRLIQRVAQTKHAAAKSNAAVLAGQVRLYMLDCGMPPDGATVSILWERPAEADAAAWKGPYVESADKLLDPWGREYILETGPNKKNADFDVISHGADGKPGGEGEDADVVAP